jgi:hypothetical protein
MHVLDNWLVAPGAKLADGSGHHVEAAPAAGDLEQISGPMKHGCGLLDVALADMGEGEIPHDDRLGLVPNLEATGDAGLVERGIGVRSLRRRLRETCSPSRRWIQANTCPGRVVGC